MRVRLYLAALFTKPRLFWLARSRSFKDFYREVVNFTAAIDPKAAVGGRWEEMGRLQFDFLISQGLKEEHKFLDVGCGSLRGGIHFIRFLNEGNYYGIDISENVIKAGRNFVAEENLEAKRPTLMVNKDLRFGELEGLWFDYVLAQSVFTHMPADDIEECIQNVHTIMAEDAVFFATYFDGGGRSYRRGLFGQNFYFPMAFFQGLGERHGYEVAQVEEFAHPRGQKMLRITRKSGDRPSGTD